MAMASIYNDGRRGPALPCAVAGLCPGLRAAKMLSLTLGSLPGVRQRLQAYRVMSGATAPLI